MGWDLVVPSSYGKKQIDVEANLLEPETVGYESYFHEEEPTCFCLSSCDRIVARVIECYDSVSEVFYEIIYGESDDGGKDI